jgi:hypothetical protein
MREILKQIVVAVSWTGDNGTEGLCSRTARLGGNVVIVFRMGFSLDLMMRRARVGVGAVRSSMSDWRV